jgi:hypothetical protein
LHIYFAWAKSSEQSSVGILPFSVTHADLLSAQNSVCPRDRSRRTSGPGRTAPARCLRPAANSLPDFPEGIELAFGAGWFWPRPARINGVYAHPAPGTVPGPP